MKKKKAISIIAVILAILMVLGLFVSILPSAYAITQDDIDELQRKKEEASARVQEAQERLDGLQEEQSNVLEQKVALDVQNAAAAEEMNLILQEIAMYDEIIEDKNQEVEQARSVEEEQGRRYRTRVRAMEENGGYNILTLLLNAHNFSDFLSALDDMGEIMESDKTMERQYRDARLETERVKAEFEAIRAEVQEKQSALRAEQARIQGQIDEANATLDALAEDIEAALEQYTLEQAAEEEASEAVTKLIAEYEEQKRREAEAAAAAARAAWEASGGGLGAGNASGSGSFGWPVPCSSRVTSRFGYRSDPFTGAAAGHAGIDIDGFGHDGDIIVAAAGGTVISAVYSGGGYGNYVLIDHGNGYQTLYAHMSDLAVGSGQWVSAGETIGYLGSTGRSTGTHCHFEIRENGTPIDPEAYFSGLSHWNC